MDSLAEATSGPALRSRTAQSTRAPAHELTRAVALGEVELAIAIDVGAAPELLQASAEARHPRARRFTGPRPIGDALALRPALQQRDAQAQAADFRAQGVEVLATRVGACLGASVLASDARASLRASLRGALLGCALREGRGREQGDCE